LGFLVQEKERGKNKNRNRGKNNKKKGVTAVTGGGAATPGRPTAVGKPLKKKEVN